ncbi:hypothetical protein AJ80_03084 [Polytolypa hystricis UAMH7299]|uniref:Homeobox domain-containing protein n=1 Tax=Polytolypa hystricis (strain UAMH7299) TaxID=1447883 RepID=A0A2B7YKR2_POLH7|nr:hypothetical protein AJ80_03084 [Polytolypa hystricis UAMH7299]
MSRKPTTGEESRDMAVSYPNGFPRGQPQTLPSFRELLPAHLHEEIESSSYYSGSSHYREAPSMPIVGQESGSKPRSVSGRDLSRSQTASRGDRRENFTLRGDRSLPDPHVGLRRQASDTSPPSMSLASDSRSRAEQVLPPLRDLQSLSERNITSYRETTTRTEPPRNFPLDHRERVDRSTNSPYERRHPEGIPLTQPLHGSVPNQPPALDTTRLSHSPYDKSPYSPYPPGYRPEIDYSPHQANSSQHPSYNAQNETVDQRGKRRRGNLPKPVTDILRGWFHEHLDHPYPSEEDKQMFITRTGLTIGQISNWFINARRRQLPALRNQVRAESERMNQRISPSSDNDQASSQSSSVSSQH